MWDFACPDWQDRLRDGRSLVPDLPLFPVEANRAERIFNKLRLPDVPGLPPMEEAAGDWFRDIVRALFGSLDQHGVRHVPELFALVPKKNSKTTGGAGIMVTALIVNRRPNAEFIFVGPTQEVADLAFQQASGMISADPEGYLQKRFDVKDHVKTIVDLTNGAQLKIKTFDMKVMVGAKPTGVLVDELHVMSSLSYASRVIGQIRGGLDPRPDGFLLFITTQSDEPPAGCFKGELQLARGIRDGRVKGEAASMLPVLYEFPEAMQIDPEKPWADPKNWPMVLPNLGLSISIDRLRTTFAGAREKGEEEVRRWASQHLNVEIGLALHADRWIGADFWEAAGFSHVTLDYIRQNCDVVVAGGDVGGLVDLWGLALIGRRRETREWLLWTHAWAQPKLLERHKEIVEALHDFEKDGDLTICEKPTQDAIEAADIIAGLRDDGLLPEKGAIGLDPAGVPALLEALAAHGIVEPRVMAVSQGYRLSSSIFGVERKLADGTFKHGGSRMMAWCVSNARVEQRGQNVYIDKKAPAKKIDPLVATFNAAEMMSRNPEALGNSVYRERGALVL